MTSSTTSIFLTVSTRKPTDIALILQQQHQNPSSNNNNESILTNNDLLQNLNKGKTHIKHSPLLQILPSYRNASTSSSLSIEKVPFSVFMSLAIPSLFLLSAIVTYFICDANGWDAVFPSKFTTHIVFKLSVWSVLLAVVAKEQAHFWYGENGFTAKKSSWIGLEVIIYHNDDTIESVTRNINDDDGATSAAFTVDTNATVAPTKILKSESTLSSTKLSTEIASSSSAATTTTTSTTSNVSPIKRVPSIDPPVDNEATTTNTTSNDDAVASPSKRKSMNKETTIPFRFIRATKGDVNAARQRWSDTCAWRADLGMDEILHKPHPKLDVIKANYPHFFHLRGKKNECCYYESPPKMNLPELRKNGLDIEALLRHYALCCEYMWTEIEDSEEGKSIYVIDLDGIGIRDFAGEVVDFVKKASSFTAAHYPERSGSIYVINVPSWFSIIWNVVKPMVDDVTKKKITIMRHGPEAITKALMAKIDIENIPPEYGGKSMPLGQSPEEKQFKAHFEKLGLMN